MALRNLVAKMRIPAAAAAAAAARLRSAPLLPPASGGQVVSFSACSANSSKLASQSATKWYMLQRERYEEATKELARCRLDLLWAERVTKLLSWSYRLIILPCGIGAICLRATGYRPTHVQE